MNRDVSSSTETGPARKVGHILYSTWVFFFFIYFRPWIAGNAMRGGFSKMGWNMETLGWERHGKGRQYCELLARSTALPWFLLPWSIRYWVDCIFPWKECDALFALTDRLFQLVFITRIFSDLFQCMGKGQVQSKSALRRPFVEDPQTTGTHHADPLFVEIS